MGRWNLPAPACALLVPDSAPCPLSPHCRAKNLVLPLLLQPWVLLVLCGQATHSSQLPPPTPTSSHSLGKKELPGKLWKQPGWGDAQGNCVLLLEGQCVPKALCLSSRCWSKRGHWQPGAPVVGRCCFCLGVWQGQWQILCWVPGPDPCPGLLQMSSQNLPH